MDAVVIGRVGLRDRVGIADRAGWTDSEWTVDYAPKKKLLATCFFLTRGEEGLVNEHQHVIEDTQSCPERPGSGGAGEQDQQVGSDYY